MRLTQDEIEAIEITLARLRQPMQPADPVDTAAFEAAVLDRLTRAVDRWCRETGQTRRELACATWPDLEVEAARSRYARACRRPVSVDALVRLANALGLPPSRLFAD